MGTLFDRHRTLPDQAVAALGERGFRTPLPNVPSRKAHGETARDKGPARAASPIICNAPDIVHIARARSGEAEATGR